ncbi:MAG: PaaX family transcriptional regulator C-terminal domain-containing protein [Microthrixaceae bacterium]
MSDSPDRLSTSSGQHDTGAGDAGRGAEPIAALTDIAGLADFSLPTRLMVLGLAHSDGTVHGIELYRVATECGIPIETVRSAMRRLIAEGLFERDGEGRSAIFPATEAGRAALQVTQERHLLAYAQDAAGRGWDGRWRVVSFAIPEGQRTERDRFRDHLLTLGGATMQPGLYVSPHRWESEVHADSERLGIAEHVSLLTTDDLDIGGVTDPRELAGILWDLDAVAKAYSGFIDTYSEVPDRLAEMRDRGERLSEHDFLPGVLHMAIRFNDCFERDPLLPPELLVKPWPGRQARELLAKCRRLGVLARSDKSGPALFSVFDDAIAHLP